MRSVHTGCSRYSRRRYGVPGFLLGPTIGRTADRWGRRWLVPAGLEVASISVALLIPKIPLVMAPVLAATLSLGYDMTQPLPAGIVSTLVSTLVDAFYCLP
jgi:MFS family permease